MVSLTVLCHSKFLSFFFVELGSDFLLDNREQKLTQNLIILAQAQTCFSRGKITKARLFSWNNNKKILAVSLFNARYWTKEWDRLHCIFKVVWLLTYLRNILTLYITNKLSSSFLHESAKKPGDLTYMTAVNLKL